MSLHVVCGDTLEVGIERCSDLGEYVEVVLSIISQNNHRILSATGTTRNVAELGGVQLLAVGVADGPKSSPGGAADRGGIGGVRHRGVMRRKSLHALVTLGASPDVHLGEVVVAESRVVVVAREVEGLHIIAQLNQYGLQQHTDVTRLCQRGVNINSHMRTIALVVRRVAVVVDAVALAVVALPISLRVFIITLITIIIIIFAALTVIPGVVRVSSSSGRCWSVWYRSS